MPENKDLAEKIKELQSENEKLRRELWRHKRKPTAIVGYGLILFGGIALVSSIIYASNISLFIGLALVFWGALLHFVKPVRYVKGSLLNSTAISSYLALDKIISELKLEGKGIYRPPKSLKDLKSGEVFIARKKNITIPPSEASTEEKFFLNPQGISFIPPGLGLVNLYEKELGTSFAKVNLDYLQDNLPKLFIEGLEIAEDFQINAKDDKVKVKIKDSIYDNFCREARKLPKICGRIGCPLCSSIACALARTTGKPIIIEKNNFNEDENTMEVQYRIVEG